MTLDEFNVARAVEDILKIGDGLPLTLYLLESVWGNKDGVDPISKDSDGKVRWDTLAVSADHGAIEKVGNKVEQKWGFMRPNTAKWKTTRILKITIIDETQEKRPGKKPEPAVDQQTRLNL